MVRKSYSKKKVGAASNKIRKDSGFEAVVLAGGAGSRLQSILGNKPKILAEINGRSFLDVLVEKLWEQNVSRVILCLGHLKDQVIEYVGSKILEDARYNELDFVLEESPLGTGGAVRNALGAVRNDHFFLINGDSLWRGFSLRDLYNFHTEKQSAISIALCPKIDAHRYGRVLLNSDGLILRFAEKKKLPGKALVNAGIYLIRKEAFPQALGGEELSLEYDILPALVKNGVCYGLATEGDFLDIGIPERYKLAEDFLRSSRLP